MYFTSRIPTLVFALAALAALVARTSDALPLKRIYDQSQSGDLNILAELDKIVILIIPSKSVNILDMDATKGQNHHHTANESYEDLLSLLGKQRDGTKSKIAEIPVLKEKVKNNLEEISKPYVFDGISYYEPSSQKLSQDLASVISASKMIENKPKTDDGALENRQNDHQELSKMEETVRADKNKLGEPEKVVALKSDVKQIVATKSDLKQAGKTGGLIGEHGSESKHDISNVKDISQAVDDATKKNELKKDHFAAINESNKKELEKSNVKVKDILKSIERVIEKTEKGHEHLQSKIKEQEEMGKDEKEASEKSKEIADKTKENREKMDETAENPEEIIETSKETDEPKLKREKPVESNSVINKENVFPTVPASNAGKTDSEDMKHHVSDVQFYKKSSSKPQQEVKNYRLVQAKLNADRINAAVSHQENKKEGHIPSAVVKSR